MEEHQKAPHIPVMADAVLEWLAIRPEGCYIDCTVGAGGHSSQILARLTTRGRLLGLDRDPEALALAGARLEHIRANTEAECRLVHANYGAVDAVVAELGWSGVDGILIDAGVSSMQLDQAQRGFSFQVSGPLDMRMDTTSGETARAWLAQQNEATLSAVLRRYGDVGPAKRIAAAILRRRDAMQLERTEDLVAAIRDALSFVKGEPDEIRTVFQAIRMAVNAELEGLERGIEAAISVLNPGGRLVVLTFHSGEDRVVKQALRAASRKERLLRPDGRILKEIPPRVVLLTRKPVLPDEEEMARNSRSKSAKLRAVQRLAQGAS